MNNNENILQLMTRAEAGFQHADDAQILFEALKSAGQTHTSPQDLLKFLEHHISVGLESVRQKRVAHD